MKLRHKGISLFDNEFDKIWKNLRFIVEKKLHLRTFVLNVMQNIIAIFCPAEMDFLYGDEEYRPEEACKMLK